MTNFREIGRPKLPYAGSIFPDAGMPGAVSGGISLVTRVSRYTDEFRGIWKRPPIDRPWVERKAPYFVRFLEHFRSFLPYVLEEDIETSVARFDQAGFLPRYWSEIFARKHAVEKRLERIRQRGGAFQDAFFLPGHHLSSQGRDLCDGLIGRWDPRQEVMWIDEVLEVKLNTPGKRSQLRKHLEWMKADGLTLGPSRLMTVRVAYEGYGALGAGVTACLFYGRNHRNLGSGVDQFSMKPSHYELMEQIRAMSERRRSM